MPDEAEITNPLHEAARTAINDVRTAVEDLMNKVHPKLYRANDLIIAKPKEGESTQEQLDGELEALTANLNAVTAAVTSIEIQ